MAAGEPAVLSGAFCYPKQMGSHIRRWALEVVGALMLSSFLFNGGLYNVCANHRPRAPSPEKGWIFPFSTKFGTCYASKFETTVLNYFFFVWILLLLIGAILNSTDKRQQIIYDPNQKKVVSISFNDLGNYSYLRILIFFVIFLSIYLVVWRITAH